MSQSYTYANPVLSLWQAAVAEVHRNHAVDPAPMTPAISLRVDTAAAPALNSIRALMAPASLIADSIGAGQTPSLDSIDTAPVTAATTTIAPHITAAPMTVVGTIVDCAKTAAKFLWAEMTGNQAQSQILAGELKDAECDPLWAECVTTYLGYKISGGNLPYRPNLDPVIDLGSATKLAIIGDWGTGDPVAVNLLKQVAALQPDVLIHLGDIYYAGTQSEAQGNFLNNCRQYLGNIPIFSMCGNHDMYSGGNGYYWLVDQLNQQASYFCLQNADWQFLAMDTGYHDNDPLTVATNMTQLVTQGSWSEANWHLKKIQQAAGRKTILLSHHQLFSAFGSVGNQNGQPYAYNPNLYASFQTVIPQVAAWFWGHEHTLALYESCMGLQAGRCVGASAVPVFTDQQSYTTATGLQTLTGQDMAVWDPAAVLGNNGSDYNNAFAFITLNGPAATVDYYQVPIMGTATKFPVSDTL